MTHRILIVEDEKSIRDALQIKLDEAGFVVFQEKNGEDGLAAALKEQPDLILLDVEMPVLTGIEMLKELRKDDWGKDAHVILLTNAQDSTTLADAVEYGVKDYLIKSDWQIERVVELIKTRLGV